MLNSLIDITGVPAFSVALVHKGQLVASVAAGYADKETKQLATPKHLFRLASVSKIVGATMLAELVQEQKLDPDMPIGNYYPELNPKYHTITLRQLMAHISGMPHYQAADFNIYNKHYNSAIEALETLKNRALLAMPGEQYHYSSHGYTLAGALYEKISEQPLGSSLPQFVESFTGKKSPIIENIHALQPLTASLYKHENSSIEKDEFGEKSYSIFGAGLSATAVDLAYFGYQVLSKSKKSEAYSKLLFSPVTTKAGKAAGSSRYQVGFGWRISKSDQGRTLYHHAGATPGARSVILLYPEEELSITLLSNSSWVASIEKTADALAELYLSDSKVRQLSRGVSYTGHYDASSFSGKITCQARACYLFGNKSNLLKTLNSFNKTGKDLSRWPIYPYTSKSDHRLLMVTKTGFINLISPAKNNRYTALTGGGKTLSVDFNQ